MKFAPSFMIIAALVGTVGGVGAIASDTPVLATTSPNCIQVTSSHQNRLHPIAPETNCETAQKVYAKRTLRSARPGGTR